MSRHDIRRDPKQRSSLAPLFIILGLVLGIPAVLAVIVAIVVFVGAYFAARAAREAAIELDRNAQQLAREVQQEQQRVRALAEARQREHERKIKQAIEDGQRDQERMREEALKRQQDFADAMKKKQKEVILPLPQRLPGTNVVDLLTLVDPKRDSEQSGKWMFEGTALRCTQGSAVPRMEIPYQPPQEYDFIVQFSQPGLRNGISLIMPHPKGGSFFWFVGINNGGYGFATDPSTEKRDPGLVKVDTIHTTVVQVRRNSVRATLDGREMTNLQIDGVIFTVDRWREIRDTRMLAIACDDPTVFHQVRVAEVSGFGKRLR